MLLTFNRRTQKAGITADLKHLFPHIFLSQIIMNFKFYEEIINLN